MEVNCKSVAGSNVLVAGEPKRGKENIELQRQCLALKACPKQVRLFLRRVPHLLGGGTLDLS